MKKITLLLILVLTTTLSFSQVSIGNGDDGSGYNTPPISPYYGYSYSQSIYLASEINTSGDITSIEYALNAGSDFSSADDNVDVWIGHTTKTAFDSTSDWVDVSTLNQVLTDGTVSVSGDILTITFSSSFAYNGTDNLVVAVDANEPGYGSSSSYVLSTNGPTAGLTLDQKSDSTNSDPTSPANGTLRQNRGNITFNGIIQSCPETSALTLDAVTNATATISWTAGGTETTWEYVVQASGTGEPAAGGTSTTTNPLTVSGLSAATAYEIYIRAACDGGDFSAWVSTTFTTSCDSVTSFPYLESFENITTGQPICWQVDGSLGSTSSYHFSSYVTGQSGRGMRFNSYNASSGETSELITPIMDASALSSLELNFQYKNPTGGDFEILISNDGGQNYTSLESGLTGQADWAPKNYDLTSYISSTMLVKFKGTSNYGSGDAYIYLDEVGIRKIPSCTPPSNITATVNSLTEVEISWTAGGNETEWTYEFGPTGFTQGSGTLTVTGPNNPITLGGLTSGATYDIYVQANCSGSDGDSPWETISWTMPVAGDTFATATTLPFTISPEGTGCSTSTISIDFPNSGFTASGLVSQGTSPTGVDAFFNWTATTDALRYWGTGSGFPYIGIHDASGTEIAYSTYNQGDVVLSGWAIGDELVIRIYDYGTSNVLVDFCLEYYTLPSAPNCAENVSPTGSDVSFNDGAAAITWDAPSSGIAPTAYEVFWGTTSGDLTSIGVLDAPTTTANILGLSYGATYYYSIVPRNGASLAVGCAEYSLTIENAPIPFSTDFTNYPAGFSESEGPYGTPSATDNTSAWVTSDFLNDATLGTGAKVNIYSTFTDEYLISPSFDLSAGTHYLNIDAGITDYNGSGADADGMGADDYVVVLFSEDDGTTWSELYRWDSTSGLTNASQAMPEVAISSTSSTAKFALYANSGASSGGDYDFHVTNFQVTTTTLGTATNTLEGFTLYPTIVKEELNFRSQNNVEAITVFNLLGQKVFSGAPNTNNSSINLSNLRPGVYVVKVSAEGKIGSYKIIKE